MLTRDAEAALNVADLHGVRQHARQAEGHPLGVLLALHGHLEAVAKVDVHNLARDSVEHQVRRVAVTQSENVSNHGHDAQRARVICAALQPGLGRLGLEPENTVQVLARRVVEGVAKHLDLLHQRQVVIVGRHLQHDAVLNVKEDLAALAVLADENMKRVAVGHPAEETRVLRQRDGGEALDVEVTLEALGVVR